jgi:hypothetical protein
LKQVLSALQPLVSADEEAALALGDMLWSEPNYEFRQLAASLLGQVSVALQDPVLDRFNQWAKPWIERRLVRILVERGLVRLRVEQRDRYLEEAAARLKSEDVFIQQLGLVFLEYLVDAPDFEDYPSITRILAPLLRTGSTSLRPDLLRLVQILARKSPRETGFFLRQNLFEHQDNHNTHWLIRHALIGFPVETQEYLREGLRESGSGLSPLNSKHRHSLPGFDDRETIE